MAFCERIVGKLDDDVEEFLAQLPAITKPIASGFKCFALLLHQLGHLLGAGFAQVVGLGQGIASKLLRNAHEAFLIDHEPESVTEGFFCIRMEIGVLLALIFKVCKIVVHVGAHRPWAIESQHCGQVLEALRNQRTEKCSHWWRFQLKHSDGVAA